MLLLSFFLILLTNCGQQPPGKVFYTWQGIGPDKWASVWLINYFVDPKAEIQFTKVNGSIQGAVAFDIPNARYKRTSENSTVSGLIKGFGIENSIVADIAQIIYDIEVDSWGNATHKRSNLVEVAFRDLQKKFGRDSVPHACYIEFFEHLYTLLGDVSNNKIPSGQFVAALMPGSGCETKTVNFIHRDKAKLVEEIEIRDVLQQIKDGKHVIFVDAREKNEFDEFRIPNAINLKLRDVKPELAALFTQADKVIAYCLKDFRGFELARALQEKAKVKNIAIMKPYGINGWRELGLPVEGSRALNHNVALAQLDDCVINIDNCLKNN